MVAAAAAGAAAAAVAKYLLVAESIEKESFSN